MSHDFLFDSKKIRENPEAIISYLKEYSAQLQSLRSEISELQAKVLKQNNRIIALESENNRISVLESENASLKAQLAKYTSPHIPSSK